MHHLQRAVSFLQRPGFDSNPGPLLHVILPLSPAFPVSLSCRNRAETLTHDLKIKKERNVFPCEEKLLLLFAYKCRMKLLPYLDIKQGFTAHIDINF